MGKLKKLTFILILGLCSSLCFAKQISFQVVQHDESASNVTEQSLVIEDEVLTKFFDYGFIVTNSDAAVSTSDSMDEKLYKTGIGEAFNGYSDYFVQINLFFARTEETKTVNADLKSINFSISNAKTGVRIADSSMNNIKLEHKKDDLKKVSANLVTEINKLLRANKA